jgi:flagellar biosynthesis anti-sigma factor FlgM
MKVHSQALDAYVRTSVLPVGGARPTAPAATGSAGPVANESAHVTISAEARDLAAGAASKIDAAKVAELKEQLSQGTYQVNSQILANFLLERLGG